MTDASTAPITAPAVIGFVGLGMMGLPMAKCLEVAGFSVRGFDLSPDALSELAAAGGTACNTAAETAIGAAAVITMLPNSAIVEAVLVSGPDPLVQHLGNAVLIDMSSSAPVKTREIGEILAKEGIAMLDAPVSGGVKRAAEGSLAIMVGGDSKQAARVKPILEALGSSLFETGPLGSGHAMKALNNFVSAAGLTAACEALVVGRKFGLDPAQMIDILNVSTGRNNSTENKIKPFVLSETYAGGFSLGLMSKDLNVASDLADAVGVKSPLAHAVSALWGDARDALEPGADHTEINRYLETLTN